MTFIKLRLIYSVIGSNIIPILLICIELLIFDCLTCKNIRSGPTNYIKEFCFK